MNIYKINHIYWSKCVLQLRMTGMPSSKTLIYVMMIYVEQFHQFTYGKRTAIPNNSLSEYQVTVQNSGKCPTTPFGVCSLCVPLDSAIACCTV